MIRYNLTKLSFLFGSLVGLAVSGGCQDRPNPSHDQIEQGMNEILSVEDELNQAEAERHRDE